MKRSLLESVLRRVAPLAAGERAADAELLRRFAVERDEAAFAVLVRRHGPMVWSACRALLPLEADAEDAFQATFLALVRAAGTAQAPRALGPWLHGVACRVSLQVRRSAARRKKRERAAAASEAAVPVARAEWDRLRFAVHEEISQLPETLRTAFVLCELQGVGQEEAAAALGWKLGTLSGRLTKARQQLLQRLTRQGIPAGAVAAATITGGAATASAPFAVVNRVLSLARAGSDLGGVVSTTVLELARGATEVSMTRTKLLAATAALAAVLVAGTATTLIPIATAQRPPENQPAGTGGRGGDTTVRWTANTRPAGAAGQWEYKFVARSGDAVKDFEKVLVDHGNAGWEYCGVEQLSAGSTPAPTIVFKRPKAAARAATGGADLTREAVARWTAEMLANPAPQLGTQPATGGGSTPRKSPLRDVTKIELKHASAENVSKALDQLFGYPEARIVADPRTNSLLISAPDEVLKVFIPVVEKIDVPPVNRGGASK